MELKKIDEAKYEKAIILISKLKRLNGKSAKKNSIAEIIQLLIDSAKSGNDKAMYEIAQQYDEFGLFGENATKANYWYKKASRLGNCPAMNNLAHNYETGNGLSRNIKMAKKLYLRSAQGGDEFAMFNVGVMLEKEKPKEAIFWYKKAFRKGNSTGALELARIYILNKDFKNLKMGKFYLSKVSDLTEGEEEVFIMLKSKLTLKK